MKQKSSALYGILLVLGIGLFILGQLLRKADIGDTVPYLSIGLGCGLFGHGLGELISRRTAKKHPDYAKQQEILKNDERNTAIANRAKAKAYDFMIFVFGALFIAFSLMALDLKVILLLAGAYLFVCGVRIYYQVKYEKEM